MEGRRDGRARKRVKLSNDDDTTEDESTADESTEDESTKDEATTASSLPRTFTRPISPPPLKRRKEVGVQADVKSKEPKCVKSPFQLTWICDLPKASNRDAVKLKDILGDPLISECWNFNYLHDLNFLMQAFDPDVRNLVKVNVVHGFWKQDDDQRSRLQEQALKFPNITLRTAYMTEMFGTHHSKMLILFRHDNTAQVIIHTANMIAFDWHNMTQAIWKSPLLPELTSTNTALSSATESSEMGSGSKFKTDLLSYLKAYDRSGKRVVCKSLVEKLSGYDFSAIRAAIVASVPGKQGMETDSETLWGWRGLQNVLSNVPVQDDNPEIVIQISSIATLGAKDTWLDKTLCKALKTSKDRKTSKPSFKIVFPTANEIRRSLNGYDSGSAIHIKIQKPAQAKQLQYLKPVLCHWASDGRDKPVAFTETILDAGRKRAAPHIKTYIRFANASHTSIDWMLVTSANLSKQAWGEATNAAGDVRVCSYEIGVMVWPELLGTKAMMVPTFKTDMPLATDTREGIETVVGARIPYDLPLIPYGKDDEPWCATMPYEEFDWKGDTYPPTPSSEELQAMLEVARRELLNG